MSTVSYRASAAASALNCQPAGRPLSVNNASVANIFSPLHEPSAFVAQRSADVGLQAPAHISAARYSPRSRDAATLAELPRLFGASRKQLVYYHATSASRAVLEAAKWRAPVFEIDIATARSAFHANVTSGQAYIGHPEEFYTRMDRPFPADNVTLAEFRTFLQENPMMKVLLDVKDIEVLPDLVNFAGAVGKERCIVHAFIKNWTRLPPNVEPEPHWYREDIELFALDKCLSQLGVPLIANCRGFSDKHVVEHELLDAMIRDCKQTSSVVALGFYYPGAPLPDQTLLKAINRCGYYAWINGNVANCSDELRSVRSVAMSDELQACTRMHTRI